VAAGSGIAALGGLASLAIYRPYFIGLAGLALLYAFLTAFWEKYRAGTLRPGNYKFGREEIVLAATTLLVFLLISLPDLRGVKPGDSRTYEGEGTVIQVDQEESKVTLRHEDVEGVVPAMTMDYEVETPELLRGLKAGDQVRFRLSPAGFEFVVVEIHREKKS
jgi:Cu(I)/Ag(I) efflux system protein CusF